MATHGTTATVSTDAPANRPSDLEIRGFERNLVMGELLLTGAATTPDIATAREANHGSRRLAAESHNPVGFGSAQGRRWIW